MTTRTRDFEAHVPLHVRAECILGLDMLAHPDVRQVLIGQIAKAPKYNVQVGALAIRKNHLHLMVWQDFDGQPADPCRIRSPEKNIGVSLFVGSCLGPTTLKMHAVNKGETEGAGWKRRFASGRLDTAQKVIRAIAYLKGQCAHHGPSQFLDDLPIDSLPTVEVVEDGLTTTLFVLPEFEGTDEQVTEQMSALINRIIDYACEAERELRSSDSRVAEWVRACQDAEGKLLPPPVGIDIDFEKARELREAWPSATERALCELGFEHYSEPVPIDHLIRRMVADVRNAKRHEQLREHWSSYRFPYKNHPPSGRKPRRPTLEILLGIKPAEGTIRPLPPPEPEPSQPPG